MIVLIPKQGSAEWLMKQG